MSGHLKYENLVEDNKRELNDLSDSRDDDSEDSDYEKDDEGCKRWWCQHPAVKRNAWAVVLAHLLLFAGIGSIVAGLILEIIFHTGMNDVFRGFVLFAVGGIVLIPGAKRIGRVRFSTVWFFTR